MRLNKVNPQNVKLLHPGSNRRERIHYDENYNLRLKPTGARKIVNEFSNMLNKK